MEALAEGPGMEGRGRWHDGMSALRTGVEEV